MSVNMANIVHLLIQYRKFQLNLLINLNEITTSICSILSQYGVPIMKLIIREIFACMHIIGRILDAGHSYINIAKNSVQIGDQGPLFHHIKMAVVMSTSVVTLMVGRSRNIIQSPLSWIHADMVISALKCTVPIITLIKIEGLHYHNGLKCFLKHELWTFLRITTCLT